jgi:hypothetical protein
VTIDRTRAERLLRAGESGISEWNQRRNAGEGIPPLDGINLSGALLKGVNLQGANLSHANLSGADLSGANLSTSLLRDAVVTDAKVLGANFSGAVLSGIDLRRTECLLAPGSVQPFEQLKQFYDYTKWHVQLYAGGTLLTLLLSELGKDRWVMLPLVAFLLAAACAGTLLGNVSRCTSEAMLDRQPMEAFGRSWYVTGRRVRIFEKLFFWAGVTTLVWVVHWRPSTSGSVQCCALSATVARTEQPPPSPLSTVTAPLRPAEVHAPAGALSLTPDHRSHPLRSGSP